MCEAKFTKGSWAVVRNGAGAWTVEFDCGPIRGNEYLQINPTSSTGSECCNEGETARQNAHLIAVAPEMYEMLEMLISMPTCDAKYFLETDDAILKLLAKARGEHV